MEVISPFAIFSADTIKLTLPISYDTNLPHFDIPVGKTEDKVRLNAAYDTCEDTYSLITISGIVLPENKEQVAKRLMTTLLAVIEYFLPMRPKQGHSTLLKVAIGDKVAVNTILEMSLIKAAKLSLDLGNDMVDPR
eukprot:14615037-Ditylum_brightwellii.AAC.1